jgi:hypothetical protein
MSIYKPLRKIYEINKRKIIPNDLGEYLSYGEDDRWEKIK